jgi:hypothetical protein
VLLTRPPLPPGVAPRGSLDLHVLGTPPAFVLSQDQTLQLTLDLPSGSVRTKGMHTVSVSQ